MVLKDREKDVVTEAIGSMDVNPILAIITWKYLINHHILLVAMVSLYKNFTTANKARIFLYKAAYTM